MKEKSREVIVPKDKAEWLELRKNDITSTEVSALFGLSPYSTEYELWYRKKDKSDQEFNENERMKWGTRLESAIAQGIAEDNNLDVRPMKEYIRLPEIKMGSSFDYAIEQKGILEIKNVDALMFKQGWAVDGDNIEAPMHIEIQVQHQLAVSGREFAFIGAFIGGNNVVLIRREPDPEIIKQMQDKIFAFWVSIEKNEAPKPDFERDAKFIKQVYSSVNKGTMIEATEQIDLLARKYKQYSDAIKEYTDRREATKAEMLTLMNDAEKVVGKDFSISAGMVKGGQVSYVKEDYRNFRVTFKKGGT